MWLVGKRCKLVMIKLNGANILVDVKLNYVSIQKNQECKGIERVYSGLLLKKKKTKKLKHIL